MAPPAPLELSAGARGRSKPKETAIIPGELRVCEVDDLDDGRSLRVEVDGGPTPAIAIHRVGDDFYATDDLCTHEDWSLGDDGDLDGYEIVCCLHQAAFDVRTGEVTRFPATEPLRSYPTRVHNGAVWVDLKAT